MSAGISKNDNTIDQYSLIVSTKVSRVAGA